MAAGWRSWVSRVWRIGLLVGKSGRIVGREVLGGGGDSVSASQARVSEGGGRLDRGARPQPKPGWISMYFT